MANPFDKVKNQYAAAQAAQKAAACPHCGKSGDDVPSPNKKDAEAFQKGMETQPDYIKNIKEGLGIS